MDGFEKLVEMSNRYGSNSEYVLAGGGNTSYKENGIMYVSDSNRTMQTTQRIARLRKLTHSGRNTYQ